MAELERTYNVPLRKGFRKAARYKKAKKAVAVLRDFLTRHMKCSPEQLKIGRRLNLKLWEHGIKHPPHHVKLTVVKQDDGIVKAELFGFKYEEPIKPAEEEKEPEEKTKKAVEEIKEELEKEVKEVKEKPSKEEKAKEEKAQKPKKKAAPKKKPAAKKAKEE